MCMKKYFILAAAALMMGACSNSNDEGGNVVTNPTDNTFRLKSTVAGSKTGGTRADGTDIQTSNIENGQSVWAEFTSTAAPTENTGTSAGQWSTSTNKAVGTFTADGSGNLTGTSIKWPVVDTATPTANVSIKAWAPAIWSTLAAAPTSWEVKTDQTAKADYLASDLLYGTRSAISYADITNPVTINFEHKLAKINVKIAGGTDVNGNALATSDYANAKIVFAEGSEAAPTTAYLVTDADISGSTVTAKTTSSTTPPTKSAITVTTAYNASENASAIIIPQTVVAGSTDKKILFTVTLPTKTYKYTIAANKEFKAGYEYTYNITLRGDTNTIILTEQIAKWSDGGSEAIIAQ